MSWKNAVLGLAMTSVAAVSGCSAEGVGGRSSESGDDGGGLCATVITFHGATYAAAGSETESVTLPDGQQVRVRPGRPVGSATMAPCDDSASDGDQSLELFEIPGLPAERYLYAQPNVGLMEITDDPEVVN